MNIFKAIWKAIDGKKLAGGAVVTLAGVGAQALDVPGSEILIATGLGTMGVGGGHKVAKRRRKNNV